MPNSSSKESDRRYGKRKSSDEEHYSKSIPNYSNKDKKSSQEVKQPIRSVGEWSEFLSSSGKIYYYNCKTEKAQWDKPEEWEWLLSQEEKLSKNYYSKDYKTNRYRGKYDEDPFDSKQRYDSQRSYPRGSSSFRPNSYNNSYNMNEPSHRPVYNNNNIQSSSISASGGGGGGEYYENSSNMSSSSSNDYYNNNYRNYGQTNKNEQDKYWNDSRASKSRSMGNNQKMDDLSYKISPSRYPTNNNYNNYDDPANHGNKHFMYQKQHHPSRFENYNEKNLNDQYHSSSMYNNNNNNNYYNNNNNNNNNQNDIEMREQNRFKYSNNRSLPTEELNENHNITNNNNNISRTTSRSKSSNSNMSRSDSSSQRSSGSGSSSNENDNNKNNNKKHKKSRKRSKKQQDGKNSKLKVNNSPIKQVGNKNGENENSNDNYNKKNETDSLFKQTDQNASNDNAMHSQTDHDSNSNKLNNSLKTQKSTEDNNNTKFNSKQSNDDSNKTENASDKKDLHSLENFENNNNNNNSVTNTNQGNNSTTSNNSSASNATTSNHNSIFMPVLLSTVEDINKYYKPELLTRIAGIDLNQNLNLINSQVFMKHLQCTSLAAELKNYRSLVRFKEIKKTLQEQRLQFLQNQMKEIEELLN